MEGIVAKRCLRESTLGRYDIYTKKDRSRKENYSNVYRKNFYASKKINKEETKNKSFIEKAIVSLKMKLWIQLVTSMCLIILVIICNMLELNVINNNKYIRALKNEYNKNYSINDIKVKTVDGIKYSYGVSIKIVPQKVKDKVKSIYLDFKEKFSKDENQSVNIYQEEGELERNEKTTENAENDGKGVSIIETEQAVEEAQIIGVVSAISSEDNELKYIKDNNIKFVMPTKGTITSEFGAREVIFADIDPYHTGLDIANSKGTNIVSSTDGTVTKVANNKYNGNFVEITNGKVVTKYAHMDSVSIKNGASVKAGDIIGKMGETGYATGPHLHFEVVVDNVKIDPAKVLDI